MNLRSLPFVLAVFIFMTIFAHALPPDTVWTRTYGGGGNDIGYSICSCLPGGYMIVGYTSSFGTGPQSAYCIRIDEAGDTLWTRAYGGPSWDGAHYIYQTADTCFIVVGYTESFGSGGKDVYILKLNQQGDTIWTRTYGGGLQDCGYATCAAYGGGYLVVGYRNGPSGWTKGDLWLLKIDENGDTLWTKTYGGTGEDYGISMRHTLDGNYIVSGVNSHQSAGGKDAWLLKIDPIGDTIWTRTFGDTLEDVGYGVNSTSDSGYVVTGYIHGIGAWTAGDLWLIKTDSNGDSTWSRVYGSSGEDYGFEVYETPDHGFIISGTTGFGAGQRDMWLVRTDANGDTAWTQTYGGYATESSLGCCASPDGGYAVAGYTSSYGSGNADVYVVKTQPDMAINENHGVRVNPFSDRATIVSGPLPFGNGITVHIYDVSGQAIRTRDPAPGVYFVRGDGGAVQKLVKVK